jgi:phosphatidylglycerophosphate synthase
MGSYRARDLWRVPSLLSLARLPLGALFVGAVERPSVAVGILAAAAATDVLDGWYARRFDQATPTGAVVDGFTDKAFVAFVVATLLASGRLVPLDLALLAVRELAEAPLVVWWMLSRKQRRRRSSNPQANALGKLATVLQFLAVAAVTMRAPAAGALIAATAVLGGVAAASYWWRELRHSGAQRLRSGTPVSSDGDATPPSPESTHAGIGAPATTRTK